MIGVVLMVGCQMLRGMGLAFDGWGFVIYELHSFFYLKGQTEKVTAYSVSIRCGPVS